MNQLTARQSIPQLNMADCHVLGDTVSSGISQCHAARTHHLWLVGVVIAMMTAHPTMYEAGQLQEAHPVRWEPAHLILTDQLVMLVLLLAKAQQQQQQQLPD